MGVMRSGFWIIHSGTGGELQRVFCHGPDEELAQEFLRAAFATMILDTELEPGDTFKIEEGESEQV